MYDPVEREAEAPVREAEFQVLVSKYIENRITNKKNHQYFHFLAWSSVPTTVDVRPFIQPVGPKVCIPDSPLDIFSLFFTTAVIQHLVTETNRYAAQCLDGSDKQWSTDEKEMKAYLGFRILMGIVREPEIRDYWSRNELLHYSPIASRISRNRFEEITRYFHLVDNSTLPQRGQPGFHRLQKVKGVLTWSERGSLQSTHHMPVSV